MSSPAALPFTGHSRSWSSFGVPSVVSDAWTLVACADIASRADNAMMIFFMILRFFYKCPNVCAILKKISVICKFSIQIIWEFFGINR